MANHDSKKSNPSQSDQDGHKHHNHEHHNHEHHDHEHHNHDHHEHHNHNGHDHSGHGHGGGHAGHHEHMIDDFKKRFWVSLVLAIPITYLSPMIQMLFNYEVNFT